MATDVETGKTATALVRIYVLDNNQRVVVVIDAELERVKELESELVDLLENITGGIVIVDEITYYTDKNGVTHDDMTMMIIHVIDRETNEIIPADDILIVIDDNYRSIEELLIKYGVVNFYPVLGGRGAAGLAILEWALLAIALLLFLGALIFIIILCCLRRRLLKKIHGGNFVTGSRKDASKLEDGTANGVKRNASNAQSFSGDNPLWKGGGDWPDSISLIGQREYEAQERSMDFFEDDIEEAHEAIIMTSLVSEKAMMDADTASSRHLNGSLNGGLYHSGQASMMHLDNRKPADPVMSRYIDVSNLSGSSQRYDRSSGLQSFQGSGQRYDGSSGLQSFQGSGQRYDGSSGLKSFQGSGQHYDGSSGLQSFQGGGSYQGNGSFNRQGNLTEEKAFEIRRC
ncbi:uncharacterized protein [Amphiura filiformis]|uniref:uncharacterized protein n=1 Tax=Amphiura filiformis TaxID=82378 RepID=UPI003B213898